MTRNGFEPLWTVQEVADFLNIKPKTVRNKVYLAGPDQIPHVRVGGSLRFRPEDIRNWIITQNAEAA